MGIKDRIKNHFGLDCNHQMLIKIKKGIWQCTNCERTYALNLYSFEVKIPKLEEVE